ncbi:MAG: MnhB domain-containing protein [Halobacteriaceae archaeon]
MTTVVLRTTVRVVLPIVLLVSIVLFLEGHNHPGGGFIAGVLTTTAFALVYIAYGIDFLEDEVLARGGDDGGSPTRQRIVEDYRGVVALGLAVAMGTGLAAMALGYPFLTQAVAFVHGVPLYGDLEVASAVVFDLGVYLVVVGSLLTVLSVVGSE